MCLKERQTSRRRMWKKCGKIQVIINFYYQNRCSVVSKEWVIFFKQFVQNKWKKKENCVIVPSNKLRGKSTAPLLLNLNLRLFFFHSLTVFYTRALNYPRLQLITQFNLDFKRSNYIQGLWGAGWPAVGRPCLYAAVSQDWLQSSLTFSER